MLSYKIQDGTTPLSHYYSSSFIFIQKIIFLLVILAFIPVTVVVFSPTMHNISDQAEAAY